MDAIVLLNKPEGMTSFAAVSKCRHILHEKKCGHTGTLDPNASGLLIILFGKYTKYLPYCVHDHKRYHATFELGKKTDTEDIWGTVTAEKTPAAHTAEELRKAALIFEGNYMQTPPMYSAVKIGGKKLYEFARKGIEVSREPRLCHVQIKDITQLSATCFSLDAEVSSGTYIRTLITDLASAIGEYAAMTSLIRVAIDTLSLSEADSFEELEQGKVAEHDIRDIIDPALPLIEMDDPDDIMHGRPVILNRTEDTVMLTNQGIILAAYEREEDGRYHCRRGLY